MDKRLVFLIGASVIDAAALCGGDDIHTAGGGEDGFSVADINGDLPYALIALSARAAVEYQIARAQGGVFESALIFNTASILLRRGGGGALA